MDYLPILKKNVKLMGFIPGGKYGKRRSIIHAWNIYVLPRS